MISFDQAIGIVGDACSVSRSLTYEGCLEMLKTFEAVATSEADCPHTARFISQEVARAAAMHAMICDQPFEECRRHFEHAKQIGFADPSREWMTYSAFAQYCVHVDLREIALTEVSSLRNRLANAVSRGNCVESELQEVEALLRDIQNGTLPPF